MTFLKTHLRLLREPNAKDLENLSRLNTKYGIRGLVVDGRDLMLEYDASRLHEAEVLSAVRCVGVGAEAAQPLPLGGFDHTGEFRDYAWPLTGISPVNQKQK